MPAEKFGRLDTAAAQIAAVVQRMRDRGLIGEDCWLAASGRATGSASRL